MLSSLVTALVIGTTGLPPVPIDSAFARLRAAYAARDAQAAARAYAPDAEVRYAYRGTPVERYRGRAAIAASFSRFFAGLAPGKPIDLNFRVTTRTARGATGIYRLCVGGEAFFGRFDVRRAPSGLFARDVSTDATREEFDRATVPLLLPSDAPSACATP